MEAIPKPLQLRSFLDRLSANKIIEQPDTKDGIILYGSGELGKLALAYCRNTGINVRFFLDLSSDSGKFSSISNIEVFNPEHNFSIDLYAVPVAVCVATFSFNAIKCYLADIGWKTIFPFYQLANKPSPFFPLSNGWLIGDLSDTDKARINFVYDHLEDDCSREHYKNFMAWHSDYQEEINPEYPIEPAHRYIIEPLIDFLKEKSHCVIDAGAHHVQLLDILLAQRMSIDEYHAFEPDPSSHEVILSKFHNKSFPCSLYQNVVTAETNVDVPFFAGLNYCSKISTYGSLSINSVSVDSMCLRPTIIKYHTEGSELNCLKGSSATINECHPLIMTSLYHNRDGLCETAYYFMNAHKNYRYYFRLHSYQGTGFFMYAVPT